MRYASLLMLMLVLPLVPCIAQAKKEVKVTFRNQISVLEKTNKITFTCLVPQTLGKRQEVKIINYSIEPSRVYTVDGNRYAEFIVDKPVSDRFEINITAELILYKYNFAEAQKNVGPDAVNFFGDSLHRFLIAETFIEKDNSEIVAIARELKAEDRIKTLKNIYSFVNKEIEYTGYNPKSVGALKALKNKGGDCTEFTDLFVALCRALEIPSRTIDGFTTSWGNTPKHSWVEVYIDPELGWVPFDPTPNNSPGFKLMDNKYIYLSTTRNDKVLKNYHFYHFRYQGGKISVKDSFEIHSPERSSSY